MSETIIEYLKIKRKSDIRFRGAFGFERGTPLMATRKALAYMKSFHGSLSKDTIEKLVLESGATEAEIELSKQIGLRQSNELISDTDQ
jgi:hypothetical protein